MKYIIWGYGERGKRLYEFLEKDRVLGYIDVNSTDDNTDTDKFIIGPEAFIEQKQLHKHIIIISMSRKEHADSAEKFLMKNGIYNYFILNHSLPEIIDPHMSLEELLNIVSMRIIKEDSSLLFGLNLYSVLLQEYLRKKLEVEVSIIPQHKEKALGEFIKNNYKKVSLMDTEAYSSDKRIYITSFEIDEKSFNLLKCNNCITVDLFNLMDLNPQYRNDKLSRFHDIHKGSRCFIVLTGPSLKFEDLETLRRNNEYTFSVNEVFRAFNRTDWRPTYYVAGDSLLLDKYSDDLKALEVENCFFASSLSNKERVESIGLNYIYQHKIVFDKRLPYFSHDITKGVYIGTVVYYCLQIAFYMGFKEIYIIGADMSNYSKSEESHFIKDYDDKSRYSKKELGNFYLEVDRINLAYKSARVEAENIDVKIYNATRGGALEVFERVNFDKLFDR